MPCVANPAENVTACCSAMPTSKARLGMAFIMMFMDEPDGMAGVTPMLSLFLSASSTSVWTNPSGYFGGMGLSLLDILISTVKIGREVGRERMVSLVYIRV